jgi:Arc/MetJ family transcription regulator
MMRTNIVIDDSLMKEAMKASGLKTKRAVVEAGLRLVVELRDQARALRELKGIGWDGDLDEMRGKRRR